MSAYRPPGFEVYFRSYRLFYATRLLLLFVGGWAVAAGRWGDAVIFGALFGVSLIILRLDMWVHEKRHPGWHLLAYEESNAATRLAALHRGRADAT